MTLRSQNSTWQQEETSNIINFPNDPLAIIYNESVWRLSMLSPLYKLKYALVKLKMTGAKIRQALVSTIQAASVEYTVSVVEIPNFKFSEDDPSALMITVSSSLEKTKPKEVYTAVLLSWGVSESCDMATHLPYMLEHGEQRVGTAVKSTLQTLYDCNITQLSFTQHQLLQFGFNFVDNGLSRNTDPFTLTYRDHDEKLRVSFDVGDIYHIWNRIKDDSMSQSELVNLAYQLLQHQIFDDTDTDITVFDLTEVSLPKAEIKKNGTVRMKTPEIVNSVFTVLNEFTNIRSKVNDNTT